MTEPLKPCPFCGGEPTFKRNEPGSESCKVICAPCLVIGPVRATRQTAIEAWNRRAQSPPVAQVEVYRMALEMISQHEDCLCKPGNERLHDDNLACPDNKAQMFKAIAGSGVGACDDFDKGVAFCVAWLISSHGEDGIALELLSCAGTTLKGIDVEDLNHIKRAVKGASRYHILKDKLVHRGRASY